MEDMPEQDLNEQYPILNSQNVSGAPNTDGGLNNGISVPNAESNSRNIDQNISDIRNENENITTEGSHHLNEQTSRAENMIRSILELNDTDLTFIVVKLKLKAKLEFAKTCRRLYRIVQRELAKQYFTLNLQDIFYCNILLEDFFSLVGPSVLTYLSKESCASFALMDYYQHMTYLQHLHFRNHDLYPGYLKDLLPKMRNITKLVFYKCQLNDDDSYLFSKLPFLKDLIIVGNEVILGHHIYRCKHLAVLSLRKCKAVQALNFAKFCYYLKHLESLDVVDCCEEAYQEVFNHLPTLRLISLSCRLDRINYEMLAEMPLIRQIEIACYNVDLTIRLLQALIDRKANDIEQLKITYPQKITVSLKYQTYMLSSFTNLREISWRSFHRDNTFFYRKILEGMPFLNSVSLVGVGKFSTEEFEGMLNASPFLRNVDVRLCKFVTNEYIFEACLTLKERHQKRQFLLDETYFQKRRLQLRLPDLQVQPHENRRELQHKILEKAKLPYAPKLPIHVCNFMVFGTSVTEEIVYYPVFDNHKEYLFLEFSNWSREESDSEGECDSESEDWLEAEDYYFRNLYP